MFRKEEFPEGWADQTLTWNNGDDTWVGLIFAEKVGQLKFNFGNFLRNKVQRF